MMPVRIIARLDIKENQLIKGIHLEGWHFLGNPTEFSGKYYNDGVDELIYMDTVASLYERNNLLDIITKVAQNIFIPLTVGGGIRSLNDIKQILRSGADKVAINTYATKSPEFITQAAKAFGSQCIVGSIEAKRKTKSEWEAYIDNGRERTGLDVIKWAKKMVKLGAGELLITSVDKEGTATGYDIELMKQIAPQVNVPVIACGGAGNPEDVLRVIKDGNADAVSAAHIFHYQKYSIQDIKNFLKNHNIDVR